MTIGRTHDPENPLRATACKAASLLGTGSRTPSGPAVMAPRQQAGHMIAIDPPVRILFKALASEGPSTQAQRAAPYDLRQSPAPSVRQSPSSPLVHSVTRPA